MARLRQEGPLTVLVCLDLHDSKADKAAFKDAPPGTLAVSAGYQKVEDRMTYYGFARMVEWKRPDSGEILILWRKPGLKMPKKGMSQPPKWRYCYTEGESWYVDADLFACCGVSTLDSPQESEIARVYLSIKKPFPDSIRIWEGSYHSINELGKTVFNRRVRVWIQLPSDCQLKIHDTRLI